MESGNVSAIILNYNDADTTISLVKKSEIIKILNIS